MSATVIEFPSLLLLLMFVFEEFDLNPAYKHTQPPKNQIINSILR
jgi:hypothetical protein